jgi:hypothetical protein
MLELPCVLDVPEEVAPVPTPRIESLDSIALTKSNDSLLSFDVQNCQNV